MAILRERYQDVLLLLIVLAASYLAFGTVLNSYFIDDDFNFIYEARHTPLGEVFDPFNPRIASYRIVTFSAFALLHELFALDPYGYHLFKLILHLANAALVFCLARRLLTSRMAAFAGALLFGACRLHNYTIFVPSNLADELALFFILMNALFYHAYLSRHNKIYLAGAILAFAAALLSKENALIVPFILFGMAWLESGASRRKGMKQNLAALTAFFAFALIYGLFMLWLKNYYVSYVPEYEIRFQIIGKILEYFGSLACLTLFQEMPALAYIGIALTMLILLAAGSGTCRFLIAWFVLFALPFSPFLHNFHRALYVPAVGFYLLVGHLLTMLYVRTAKRSTPIAGAAVVVLLSLITTANMYLSRRDIAEYDRRASNLKVVADHAQAMVPPVPSESFILVLNAPDESWIIEDIFQLFNGDGTIRVIGMALDAIDAYSLTRLGDNPWTWDQTMQHLGRVPRMLILLEFVDGRVLERRRIRFLK
jgi:hypothetical protein